MDEQPAPAPDMSRLIRELAHRGPEQRTAIAQELYRQARLTPAQPDDDQDDQDAEDAEENADA